MTSVENVIEDEYDVKTRNGVEEPAKNASSSFVEWVFDEEGMLLDMAKWVSIATLSGLIAAKAHELRD